MEELARPEIDKIDSSLPYHKRKALSEKIYAEKANLLMPQYEEHLKRILNSTPNYNMYVRRIVRG